MISLGSLMAAVLCSGGSGREAVTVGPPRIATASPPPPYTGTYMVQLTTDDVFTFPLDLYLPTNHLYINGMCSYPQCTMQHNAMCWGCVKCHRHPRKVHLPPLHILMSHAPLLSVARQSDRTIEYLEGGGIVSLQLHAAS